MRAHQHGTVHIILVRIIIPHSRYKGIANPDTVAPLPKTYVAELAGTWEDRDPQIEMLRMPLFYEGLDVYTQPASVKVVSNYRRAQDPWPFLPHKGWRTIVEITLNEGRNRQIRRLCKRSKLKLRSLSRVSFGSLYIGDLGVGECRHLRRAEVDDLYARVMPLNTIPIETAALKALIRSSVTQNEEIVQKITSFVVTRKF